MMFFLHFILEIFVLKIKIICVFRIHIINLYITRIQLINCVIKTTSVLYVLNIAYSKS